ncbi:MAG: N-acetyltransferase [Eggerthellaceae bacterium]|nr:N-acetyltransferase [Eggerthellaceae bacterium]
MIRIFSAEDINSIMDIWLEGNIQAHEFIPERYWTHNYDLVRSLISEAEVYVYENVTESNSIAGFIGLQDNYIAGLFIREDARSKGIGKQLLDFVKQQKQHLSLHVYKQNERAVSFYLREGFAVYSENLDEATGAIEYEMHWNCS